MLKQPMPSQVKQAREAAGLSREQAAELVHATYRTWQNWELEASSPEAREIPLAVWELFLRKIPALTPAAGELAGRLLGMRD